MPKENNSYNYSTTEDPTDLLQLIKTVWTNRKLIVKTAAVFLVIGCIVALMSPVVYVAQTTFVPQISEQNNNSLGSLASLAGININQATTNDNYLSPMLYSKVIDSDEFLQKIIEQYLTDDKGDSIKIKNYLNESKEGFKILGFIRENTIGLISSIVNKKQEKIKESKLINDYNIISNEDYSTIIKFKSSFEVNLFRKDGYIEVVAYDKNALISAQLVKIITKNLQEKIIEIRTKKIKDELIYSEKEYENQRIKFEIIQNKRAKFKDSNTIISSEMRKAELDKINSEYQLQEGILRTIATAHNQNKMKLNKKTPIFSVIDEVSVPNVRYKPKRTQIVLVFLLIGMSFSITFILFGNYLINLFRDIIK